ncbi:MAG: hypothetical protein ACE5Q6_19715 [Dehalococcoidia bacterium]
MEDLKTLKLQLALLQSACLLASEGQSRVTSSEVLFRAKREYGVDAMASTAGQLLGSLGLPSSTSKGKTRFLLDPDDLQPLVEDLNSQVADLELRVEQVIESFGQVEERLQPLEQQFNQVVSQVRREGELKQYIETHRLSWLGARGLEDQAQQVAGQYAHHQRLRSRIQEMQELIKTSPELERQLRELEPKVKDLEARQAELDQEEQAIAQQEKELGIQSRQLTLRGRFLTAANLDREITQKQEELASLNLEIDNRRSFLDKLLGRNDGRDE